MAGIALRRGVRPGHATQQYVHDLIQQNFIAVDLLHAFHDATPGPIVVRVGQPGFKLPDALAAARVFHVHINVVVRGRQERVPQQVKIAVVIPGIVALLVAMPAQEAYAQSPGAVCSSKA